MFNLLNKSTIMQETGSLEKQKPQKKLRLYRIVKKLRALRYRNPVFPIC